MPPVSRKQNIPTTITEYDWTVSIVTLDSRKYNGSRLEYGMCMESNQPAERGKELPEDLGVKGATMLLQEVQCGGCVDYWLSITCVIMDVFGS